jgi:nitrogen fixation protein FixH
MSVFLPRIHPIPLLFVAGFAIVIAVNGIMVWIAIDSFSGLYSDHAREHGMHYNEMVAEQQARDRLGWRANLAWRPEARRLEIEMSQADGSPLRGAAMSLELVRPAEKMPPFGVAMDDLGDGRFAGYVDLPERGNWDLDIVVEAEGQRYAITKRAFLR